MYEEGFYYGRCKVVVTASGSQNEGKTVSVVSASVPDRQYTGVIHDGICIFFLPNRDKYTISLMDGEDPVYSTAIVCGYGEYKEVEVGLYTTSVSGIVAIINSGEEANFFTAGDQVQFKEGDSYALYDVLAVDYRNSKYGNNVIFGRHSALETARTMNATATNMSGFKNTDLCKFLNETFYSSLEEDLQRAIKEYDYMATSGGRSQELQEEKHKIWLPLEWNVFGANQYAGAKEHTDGGAEQFEYFATTGKNIKTLGNTSANTAWWMSSPVVSTTANFCAVNATGKRSSASAKVAQGVVPCFMIAAEE